MNVEKDIDQLALAANQRQEEKEYWLEKLSRPLAHASFPHQHNKAATPDRDSFMQEPIVIDDALVQRLLKISRGSEHTLHIILAAAHQVLLARYTGETDIIIGTPIYKPEKESHFINTALPLRASIPADITFKTLLGQLVYTLNAVPTSFVNVLSGVSRSFVNLLNAIKDQKEAA